ncbi:type I-E CRISPR-associated protein Cse2/CasB [Boseongicola sp. H5]|uniref:type I-E CRISPR-associated protein Cse2/CasB n=1 Tax=Boseongicola sp. H5 TaxID=2763261 RepID=UPI001D0BB2CB|nr:type I-E CRISPR-associated protein Cse2/CasB [Boseongicola sp. H5]
MTKAKGSIIGLWWATHIHAQTGAARALGARLRRAERLSEVLANAEVIDLGRDLCLSDPARLALIAQTVAAVKERGESLPRAFGRESGDRRLLSELRFQRLLRADPDGLRRGLRRALPLVDHRCDVAALGSDLFHWGEHVRTRWCFDYFGGTAPPRLTPETEETDA